MSRTEGECPPGGWSAVGRKALRYCNGGDNARQDLSLSCIFAISSAVSNPMEEKHGGFDCWV